VGGSVQIDLSSLSVDDLHDLNSEIDQTLCAIFKVSTNRATRGVEEKMRKAISTAWKSTAGSASRAGMKELLSKPVTQKSVDKFLRSMGIAMATPLTAAQIKLVTGYLRQIWRISKQLGAKEAKIKFSFTQVDRRAVKAISKHQVLWVGDFYDAHLSKRIRAVTEDVMIKQGFGRRQAGPILRKALGRELGLTKGGVTEWASSVPARYAGNPDLYFTQLAATTSHQSRTFGKLTAFNEAGIVRYRLVNPNDERTGKICQQMHGQTFTVQVGVKHMGRILDAEKPEDIKRIAPWLSGDELESKLHGKRPGSPDASDALTRSGAILPPFHPLCRTEVVVLS
jgi:hypothetical protein